MGVVEFIQMSKSYYSRNPDLVKDRIKRRRERLRLAGMCTCCGQRKARPGLNWCTECAGRSNAASVAKRVTLKNQVLDHYGNECECCGEDTPEFLSVDHIGGGGKQHRLKDRSAHYSWRWLVQHNFPKGFRVLCFNCNFATSSGRICPHQLGRRHNGRK